MSKGLGINETMVSIDINSLYMNSLDVLFPSSKLLAPYLQQNVFCIVVIHQGIRRFRPKELHVAAASLIIYAYIMDFREEN